MKKTLIFLASLMLTACSDNLDLVGMFAGQSPDNDTRFKQSRDYIAQHEYQPFGFDTLTVASDTYRVYFATDMHIDSTWRNTSEWCNRVQADTLCPFAIVLGDIVNAQGNYPHFMTAMKPLTKPWFVTVGNHDIYFGQWQQFVQHLGTSVYTFEVKTPAGTDLFICLDSGDGTLGNRQMEWIKQTLAASMKTPYRHKLLFTHTHPFKRDSSQEHTSNFNLEETYEMCDILSRYGVEWCITGHDHAREITDFKGVRYIIVDSLQDPATSPGYMIATIGSRLLYDFIAL